MPSRPRPATRYDPAVMLTVPVLLAVVGLALILGRKSPPWIIAGVALLIGSYIGGTSLGKVIVSWSNQLARFIG